jgi:hypothetical protein
VQVQGLRPPTVRLGATADRGEQDRGVLKRRGEFGPAADRAIVRGRHQSRTAQRLPRAVKAPESRQRSNQRVGALDGTRRGASGGDRLQVDAQPATKPAAVLLNLRSIEVRCAYRVVRSPAA